MKRRAIIYLGVPPQTLGGPRRERVSKQGIDRQFKRCLDRVISMGALFVTFYADFGEPTLEPDRTGLAAMLRDLEDARFEIDLLVVEDEAYLAATQIQSSAVREALAKANIELIALGQTRKNERAA